MCVDANISVSFNICNSSRYRQHPQEYLQRYLLHKKPSMIPKVVPTYKKADTPTTSKVSLNEVVVTTVRRAAASLVAAGSSSSTSTDSVPTLAEAAVIIATHAAVLDISDTYISIASAAAVPEGCMILIHVEMPYDADAYSSPLAVYTALTSAFIDAYNSGEYAAELETQAVAVGVASLQGATISRGYVTRPDDIRADAATHTDRKQYGLIALSVIPIASVVYAMYGTCAGAGDGLTESQ